MNKKILSIIAILALVPTFIMAQTVGATGDAPTYSSIALPAAEEESTTVVAVQEDVAFSFIFEAKTTDNSWVSANSKEIYDSAWSPRSDFTASFRARVEQGTSTAISSLSIKIEIGNLARTTGTSYDTGLPTLSARTLGTDSLLSIAQGTASTSSPLTVTDTVTLANNVTYGADEDKNSVYFDVTYTGDSTAPAGRYESIVKLNFTAS
ncbi:MAG: hypothetical protein ACPKM0_06080 [Pleomorphochaeta sp.]